MELSNQINDIIENTKSLVLDFEEERMTILKKDLSNAAEKAIDHASKYIIKAMPLPDAVKDILLDIKDSIKTKDMKQVISTAIKSTVREGMEALGLSNSSINSILDLKNAASKGGLVTALKNGVEIVSKNYLKNSIVGDYVYDFFEKLKGYIMNKEFSRNLDRIVNRLQEKKEAFLKNCEEWYESYKEKDIVKMNKVADELGTNKYILSRYSDCAKENSIIQNMTAMINNKKETLTANQERLCTVI